jgi:hypothetical protein
MKDSKNEKIEGEAQKSGQSSVQIPTPARMLRTIRGWVLGYLDFRNLDSFLLAEKGSGNITESIPIILLAQAVSAVTLILAFIAATFIYPNQVTLSPSQLVAGLLLMVLVGGTLIYYLSSIALYIASLLLGGKGELSHQLRVMSIPNLASNIISSPLAFLNVLVVGDQNLSLGVSALLMAIGFYELFVFYKTIRVIHGLSMFTALLALIGTMFVLFVLAQFFVFGLMGG